MAEDDDVRVKSKGQKILENSKVQLFLLIVTLYALFADDYRYLTCKKEVDVVYDVFNIICIVIFTVEIVVSCIFKPGYFNSYYFYLDIISTASLILDFTPVKNEMIEFSYTGTDGISKLGKLIRLIRLFRLVRIGKIYKSLSAQDSDHKKDVGKKKNKRDSKVGRQLSELATKAVIIMCFTMLILLPLFDSDFWINPEKGEEGISFGFKTLMDFSKWTSKPDLKTLRFNQAQAKYSETDLAEALAFSTFKFKEDLSSDNEAPLLKIKFPDSDVDYYAVSNYSDYRLEEVSVGVVDYNGGKIYIHQEDIKGTTLDAILNIIRTFYICAILLGGSALFSISTYNLIIRPIERMTEKVIDVIERPQQVKETAFIEQEELEAQRDMINNEDGEDKEVEEEKKKQSMETVIVEDAIKKIGILLGVGLGEAGSSLIESYLTVKKDEKGGSEALMKNVFELDAIFGFCDIRNFTDATEVLQSGVMVFVNTIADIVHTIADRNLGAANKNIGDAFLIVWKIPLPLKHQTEMYRDPADKSPMIPEAVEHHRRVFTDLADLSMFAIMKMFAEINRSWTLVKYVQNEGLRARIGASYKPKLGFGLHFGWAIEGAIGSYHKVDVSYLSPHVNVASFLEGSTKEYGSALLLSGEFYDILTPEVQAMCRQVDKICNPGQPPMRIYTPFMSDVAFAYPKQEPLKQHIQKTKECYTFKKLLKNEILRVIQERVNKDQEELKSVGPALFENDVDIRLLLCQNNPEFLPIYNQGYEAFEKGNWTESKRIFEQALAIMPEDGPSKKLLGHMQETNFQAPENWQGYRSTAGGGH